MPEPNTKHNFHLLGTGVLSTSSPRKPASTCRQPSPAHVATNIIGAERRQRVQSRKRWKARNMAESGRGDV